jgi:hypothetical protein
MPIQTKPVVQIKNVDLYLLSDTMIGGNPELILTLVANSFYPYLSNVDKTYIFQFDPHLNTQKFKASIYFTKGSITAVFVVNKIKSPDLSIPNQDLILRMVDPSDSLDGYIKKLQEDLKILPYPIFQFQTKISS